MFWVIRQDMQRKWQVCGRWLLKKQVDTLQRIAPEADCVYTLISFFFFLLFSILSLFSQFVPIFMYTGSN